MGSSLACQLGLNSTIIYRLQDKSPFTALPATDGADAQPAQGLAPAAAQTASATGRLDDDIQRQLADAVRQGLMPTDAEARALRLPGMNARKEGDGHLQVRW